MNRGNSLLSIMTGEKGEPEKRLCMQSAEAAFVLLPVCLSLASLVGVLSETFDHRRSFSISMVTACLRDSLSFLPCLILFACVCADVDEGGQTDFPDLPKPLAIKPQKGAYIHTYPSTATMDGWMCGCVSKGMAIVWSNVNPDGSADYRMMHQGLPPTSSVKYAVNCFINRDPIRLLASDEQRGPFCPFSSPKMQ